MKTNKPVYVTKPTLPALEEFLPYLEQIWDRKILTNGGPFHKELEEKLCEYLGVKYISLFCNGTIALMTALQSLGITGEVITTPYSFVATAHSLIWNNLKPVFVDIDPRSFNLDPNRIEEAITPQTTAILPVHCYGNPCDVERIQQIADRHGLKVIYDAAHAFGVSFKEESILSHGDLSVLSFHATKVFNTFEGGAIVCADSETKKKIDFLKNFGIADEVTVVGLGTNGKMNELQAAIGLLQLKNIDHAIRDRKKIDTKYRIEFAEISGISCMVESAEIVQNHAYFPILIEQNFPHSRDSVYQYLKEQGFYTRRYFYPLISDMPMYRDLPSSSNLLNAKKLAEKILCLPIYPNLAVSEQKKLICCFKELSVRAINH
jgi:dTDP-4-amino-4,6-dideoxygalactose transaminase